jgi:hypothetical protein
MTEATLTDGYLLTKKFRSATEFSVYIEEYCMVNHIGYMDALIDYCEKKDIEVESIASLVSKSLKEKMRVEAEEQNFFRAKGKLEL